MHNVTGVLVQGHIPIMIKYINITVPGHVVDCTGFITGIYTNIDVSYVYMKNLAHVAYMWHERHISFDR